MSDVSRTPPSGPVPPPSGPVPPPVDLAHPPDAAGTAGVAELPQDGPPSGELSTGRPPPGASSTGRPPPDGLNRTVRLQDVLRFTGGLGLDDLRHAGRAELGGLVEGLRRGGLALRRHPALSGDLIWRLAGIMVTAWLSCLLDSPVTRALAQAGVIAALTIALSWPRKDPAEPRVPLPRVSDRLSAATSDARSLPSATTVSVTPVPTAVTTGHAPPGSPDTAPPIPTGDTAPPILPEVARLIPPEAARLIPPDAGHGSVVLCRVIPTPTQFLLVVTVVDLPPGTTRSR